MIANVEMAAAAMAISSVLESGSVESVGWSFFSVKASVQVNVET